MPEAQRLESCLRDVLQLGFDPAAVREKYGVERDKRLRPEGSKQYIKMDGEFENFNDDHFVEVEERPAVSGNADVVIVGAGFGGLQAGAHLRREGIASSGAARGHGRSHTLRLPAEWWTLLPSICAVRLTLVYPMSTHEDWPTYPKQTSGAPAGFSARFSHSASVN